MAPTTAASGSTSSAGAATGEPQLLQTGDLIASLPAPVLRLLVLFAKPISYFKRTLEVLSWRSGKRVESWIVVALWWGICLGASHAFMYLLPPLIFSPLLPLSTLHLRSSGKTPPRNTPSDPSTSETLLLTLSELNAIYALLPQSPIPNISSIYERFKQLGPVRLLRGLVVLWAVWLVLGRMVGYRTLLALLGTVILLLPSPPLAHLTNLLSKSLFIRRGLALAFLFTFGSPPESSYRFSLSFSPLEWVKSKWTASRRPSLALSFRPQMTVKPPTGSAIASDAEAKKEKVENPIYFRFEVHENQRWWMGLDWTSALLPQERPSWCDLHLQPTSPPPSFTLPSSVSIIVPSPTPSNPKARTLRTATWKWLDDDWSIVRAGPGMGGNIVPPPPVPAQSGEADSEGSSGFSVNAQRAFSRPSSFSFGSSPPKGPSLDESTPSAGARAQSIAEQAFTKGLERLKARTVSAATSVSSPVGASGNSAASVNTPVRKSIDSTRTRAGSQASDDAYLDELAHGQASTGNSGSVSVHVPTETIVGRDEATDADGWVYGDNKWENMGAKGGLGKFTRRRRWKRRAVCIETITRLSDDGDPGPTRSLHDSGEDETNGEGEGDSGHAMPKGKSVSSPLKATPVRAISDIKAQTRSSLDGQDRSQEDGVLIPESSAQSKAAGTGRDDLLRMRLKKAMGSVGA